MDELSLDFSFQQKSSMKNYASPFQLVGLSITDIPLPLQLWSALFMSDFEV